MTGNHSSRAALIAQARGLVPSHPSAPSSAELSELPVFVTPDGSARRTIRWLGRLSLLALAVWIAAMLAGASAFTRLPPLPTPIVAHANSGPRAAHGLALATSTTVRFHARG